MAKPIVLIHGAWHAKWCWRDVEPRLAEIGHDIYNLDLPGHGDNLADFKKISLNTYVDYVVSVINKINEPVVLVGHSLAGVVISQVAEYIPEKIDRLIYVTAFIPENGRSLTDEAGKSARPGITTELIVNLKENEVDLKKSARVSELFYNLCAPANIDYAASRLQKEPYRPLHDSVRISAAHFGKVQKHYIACAQDEAVTLIDQQRMWQQHQCQSVTIHADHSPFFSAPDDLAAAILNCLNQEGVA